jgi:hypothetical protein
MVSLKYSLTKEDYVNYYTYMWWDAPGKQRKRLLYYVRQLLPLLLFFIAFYYTGLLERSGRFILITFGLLLATTLLSFIGVRTNTMRQAEKITEDPENASFFLEVTAIVSETGISMKDELQETKFQWRAFTKKLESRNYYFLFINSMQALIIPKRIFNSPEEKLQFERLLTQYLSFEADVSHMLKN